MTTPAVPGLPGLEPRWIDTAGGRLRVHAGGTGPAVLLIHGLPDRATAWRAQVPALLDAGYRVIAPDLLGLGDSDRPSGTEYYSVAADTAAMLAVLDALDVGSASVICHDRGAGPGWALAALHPTRVDRLVALSIGHLAAFADTGLSQRRMSWYMLFFQFKVEAQLRDDDWRLLRTWLAGHPYIAQVIADLERPGALEACLNYYRANFNPEASLHDAPPLPRVPQPVLGLWGTEDPYLGIEQMARSGEYLDGPWRFVRVDGGGHWLPLASADVVNAELLPFLAADFSRAEAA